MPSIPYAELSCILHGARLSLANPVRLTFWQPHVETNTHRATKRRPKTRAFFAKVRQAAEALRLRW